MSVPDDSELVTVDHLDAALGRAHRQEIAETYGAGVLNAMDLADGINTLVRRVNRLTGDLGRERERIATYQRGAEAASKERARLLNRISAVQILHCEAQEPDCGDGCCTVGVGVCEYDNEPWPCTTARALNGPSAGG